MRTLLIGVILLFSFCSQSYAKETLTWMVLDWPPWFMLQEDEGIGQYNYILKEAQEGLPQYDHINEEMNWSRFWYEVENTNMCYVFGVKSSKREEIVYFSNPHSLILPNSIIMRKEDIKKLGNPASYSIGELMQDTRFNGLIEKERSFTKPIDTVLNTYEAGSNLTRVEKNSESLIKMLIAGRIDYTVEYPIVASYHSKPQNIDTDILGSIPISEMDPFSYVYMACTKNEWGKNIIDEWNEILRRLKPTEKYRKIVETGYSNENELKILRENYDNFIKAQ
jgi:uncharacterized protein (TIGR02285 family)